VRRVAQFFARRIAAAIFTVLVLIALSFVVVVAVPSNTAAFVYPNTFHLSAYQIRQGNHLLGVDRPLPTRYFDYVEHLAQGDFGHQWGGAKLVHNDHVIEQPIGPQLFSATRETLSIILGGGLIVLLIAVPLGLTAGAKVGTWTDRLISLGALVGICTHPRVLAGILVKLFGPHQWMPTSGYCPLVKGHFDPCGGPVDWATHLILPWVTFALLFLALYVRIIRAGVDEAMHEDYVRTARSKGAGEPRVLTRHVLPSVGLGVLTMVGMEVSTALGVCIYIETSFNFNGLGRLALFTMGGAEASIDQPFTVAIVTMITLFVVIGNLVVDFLYSVLDPRAGTEPRRGRGKLAAGGII
jgi:peptide/nickel transport system permease protein